jgi:hypothetical protein
VIDVMTEHGPRISSPLSSVARAPRWPTREGRRPRPRAG